MSGAAPVWVLADDRPGNVGQALGVAEALGRPYLVKAIAYDNWGRLPNLLRGASLLGVVASSRAALGPPWPALVIAAGRRTAPVARWIKRRCGARLVQIMDPGPGGRGDFDLIARPGHDGGPMRANMMAVTGAPHRVTTARLADAAEIWRPRFAAWPRPWVALVVGGDTRRRPFTPALAAELGRGVRNLAGGGTVLTTTSRRTSPAAAVALVDAVGQPAWTYHYGTDGDNPYFGLLALADAVVVTGDSVSMACEACAGAAPVYLFSPPGWAAPKHVRLHRDLFAQGLARPLDHDAVLGPRRDGVAALDTAGTIARAVAGWAP